MKPVKTLLPFARWLLRISVLVWVIIHYISAVRTFDIDSLYFYIALAFIVFAVLLFAGGFSSKPTLTVLSAVFLTLLFIYRIYTGFVPNVTDAQVISFTFMAISFYFVTSANK